jgi:hypothetical protein
MYSLCIYVWPFCTPADTRITAMPYAL